MSLNGRSLMNGCSFILPVCGFSSAQYVGSKYVKISKVLFVISFASSIFLTPLVFALIYSWQSGEAQIKSKCLGGKVL